MIKSTHILKNIGFDAIVTKIILKGKENPNHNAPPDF